ncbi:DUF5994 family protein [Nonomuraea diastatica]|uniref:Uncharacterized protein n=1 Tax=Nonomuraea diastatica TaxID=1848329 RepID=A0A4R4X0Y5_9ACTN|nr:DUF5994 family protein [Nonomuraea diastatica]TDD23839.1 hypothetical protein E1294_07500 [Nonomuraea diastatica]
MTALVSPPTPSNPGTAAVATARSAIRLRLNPVLDRRGTVDGAWWPRSSDAAAELPDLISAIEQRLGRAVLRVGLYHDVWDHIPRRVTARGRQVKVGSFRSADPHLITLSIEGTAPISVLVIPPGTANDPAMAALTSAAAGTVGVGPADILHPTGQDEEMRGHDSSAAWENEGGRVADLEPAWPADRGLRTWFLA